MLVISDDFASPFDKFDVVDQIEYPVRGAWAASVCLQKAAAIQLAGFNLNLRGFDPRLHFTAIATPIR